MPQPNQHYIDEIAKLRVENDYLKAEIAYLREKQGSAVERIMAAFGITKQESFLVALLSDGETRSRGYLLDRIKPDSESVTGNYISVLMTHIGLRSKPKIEFNNRWGQGVSLTPQSLELVQKAINGGIDER